MSSICWVAALDYSNTDHWWAAWDSLDSLATLHFRRLLSGYDNHPRCPGYCRRLPSHLSYEKYIRIVDCTPSAAAANIKPSTFTFWRNGWWRWTTFILLSSSSSIHGIPEHFCKIFPMTFNFFVLGTIRTWQFWTLFRRLVFWTKEANGYNNDKMIVMFAECDIYVWFSLHFVT